jgi:signal transduction histidine kinase
MAQVLQLDVVMADFEKLLASQLKPEWRVVYDVEKGLEIWAESAQLQQVLQNLVLNGLQAMKKGGVVLLKARAKAGGVHFEIVDAGEGIAPENMEKLFDPFFTTRESGNGIGLAVVQQIVRQHAGEVKVSSTVGDGTTFTVWWPSGVPA